MTFALSAKPHGFPLGGARMREKPRGRVEKKRRASEWAPCPPRVASPCLSPSLHVLVSSSTPGRKQAKNGGKSSNTEMTVPTWGRGAGAAVRAVALRRTPPGSWTLVRVVPGDGLESPTEACHTNPRAADAKAFPPHASPRSRVGFYFICVFL